MKNKFNLINSNEVSYMLQLSKTSIFRLVQDGKLKTAYEQKQFALFELSEVQRYINENKTK